MATSTDVRQWAREHGKPIGDHGRIPLAIQQDYDAEHGQAPGPAEGDYPDPPAPDGPDYDGGVSEDDFTAADPPPAPPPEPAADGAQEAAEERRPRAVAKARRTRRDFRARLWDGGKGDKPARPAKKHARVSLKGFAEDMFLDLAWTFQGLPPMEKILYLQAPLAGTVVEDAVKGTIADKALQPVARFDRQFKALEALTAPAWVALIMAKGRKDDKTGEYSPETKLMFSGLRHSLLSMSRIVDNFDFEAQKGKAEELRTASGQIDAMIAYLFEMPQLTDEQIEQMRAAQAAADRAYDR